MPPAKKWDANQKCVSVRALTAEVATLEAEVQLSLRMLLQIHKQEAKSRGVLARLQEREAELNSW